jgi:hypothetical protein
MCPCGEEMLGQPEKGRCWPCRAAHGFRVTGIDARIDGKALTGCPPQWKMHDVFAWKVAGPRSHAPVKPAPAKA